MKAWIALVLPVLQAASTLPIPATGVYLGVWANPNSANNQEAAMELLEGPSGIGRPFALHLSYYGWTDLSQLLNSTGVLQPDANLQGDIDHGRVPVISWNCDSKTANSDHIIASGDPTEDANITAAAKALAQYPGPVMLRWFWEFNLINANSGNQPCRNDDGTAPTQQVYTDFIAAWQHIHQLFQSAGAANVIFLWNPGNYTGGGSGDPHGYYPGNGYVDWIGIDTYQRSQSATFTSDFGVFYNDFSASQYGGKPLMVGENAAANESIYNAELQPAYLNGIVADLKANLYPLLKAYDYFDAPGNAPNDWVLDTQGLSAFAADATSPAFLPAPALTNAANGATYYPGGLVSGSWALVKGTGLSNVTRIWNSADFHGDILPTSLSGVQLTVNGIPAAIYYIDSSQINFQVPAGVNGQAAIQVHYAGALSNTLTAAAAASSPGLFPNIQGSIAYPAALFSDGTYVGSRAAKPGDTIELFATGLEAEPAGTIPAPAAIQGVTVTLGTTVIPASYAGQTAYAGEFQINFTVPNLPAGSYAVSVQLNNASSPLTLNTSPPLQVTIPIQ
jgi:endoglucanase